MDMTIYDYDNDFQHYECDAGRQAELGQVWTPYSVLCDMMDKIPPEEWDDETKTSLDPTMGAGNIVIAMLYRRIAEHHQDPVKALSNVYGVELDPATLEYAKKRIKNFMSHFTDKDLGSIIDHNFVCSDIFAWDLENWCPKKSEEEKNLDLFSEFFS